MMDENFPASADVVLDKTQELLTIDELNMDLVSISKLFLLNDFENLYLKQFTQLESCYESFLETHNNSKKLVYVWGNIYLLTY